MLINQTVIILYSTLCIIEMKLELILILMACFCCFNKNLLQTQS